MDENNLEGRLDKVLKGLATVHASIDAERDARVAETKVRDEENESRDRKARRLLVLTAVAIIVGILGVYAGLAAKATSDDIVSTRSASRTGLCNAINDMRLKHNHFVQTAINERQFIIDETANNPTLTDEAKAKNRTFFQEQINNYTTDLLDTLDCKDPASLDILYGTG